MKKNCWWFAVKYDEDADTLSCRTVLSPEGEVLVNVGLLIGPFRTFVDGWKAAGVIGLEGLKSLVAIQQEED